MIRFLLPVAILLAIPGALAQPFVPREPPWIANYHAVEAVKYLSGVPGSKDVAGSAAELGNRCLSYPLEVVALRRLDLTAARKLELINAWESCWPASRSSLAVNRRLEILRAENRYDEVCQELAQVHSSGRALIYAQQAIDAGDWPAGAAYLHCLDRIAEPGIWVSPGITSDLYRRLGGHLDEIGAVDEAIAAYDRSASWYPSGIWGSPYVRKAQLLWGQGKQSEALDWLIAGVPRSRDVTGDFYLWQQLGEFMMAQGNAADALCAYRKASAVMDQVPGANLPDSTRQLTQERLKHLADEVGSGKNPCFVTYSGLQSH